MGLNRPVDAPWDVSAAVERVIGAVLAERKFISFSVSSVLAVYSRDSAALSFGYHLEELPRPSLSLGVGTCDVANGSVRIVGLWRASPEAAARYANRENLFDSQASLDARLAVMRDEWLPDYALPVLDDQARLRGLVEQQDRELDEEHVRLIDEQRLRRARVLYDSGEFSKAVSEYVQYGVDRMSAADRRRMVLARRQL